MRKLSKKLLLSILSVALVFIALGTTTFAWFSMNQSVKVSGMKVQTKVTSNLLISPNATEANFGTQLAQAKNALLEPVSTTDGINFFYSATDNVDASGDAKAETYLSYATTGLTVESGHTQNNFNENYGTEGAVGYVDYTLYLKATSTENDSKVALTDCNLIYNGATLDDENASSVSTTLASAKSLLALSGAENYENGKAVTSTTATGSVTYGTAAVIDADIDAGITRYYYVVVRLWLEGEDKTCTNDTFANLTEDYEFGTSKAGVELISSVVASHYTFAVVDSTAAGVTLTESKLSNGANPSSYVWYNMSDGSVVSGSTTNAAPSADGNYYCIITAADGNIYRTSTVTVGA